MIALVTTAAYKRSAAGSS